MDVKTKSNTKEKNEIKDDKGSPLNEYFNSKYKEIFSSSILENPDIELDPLFEAGDYLRRQEKGFLKLINT